MSAQYYHHPVPPREPTSPFVWFGLCVAVLAVVGVLVFATWPDTRTESEIHVDNLTKMARVFLKNGETPEYSSSACRDYAPSIRYAAKRGMEDSELLRPAGSRWIDGKFSDAVRGVVEKAVLSCDPRALGLV